MPVSSCLIIYKKLFNLIWVVFTPKDFGWLGTYVSALHKSVLIEVDYD